MDEGLNPRPALRLLGSDRTVIFAFYVAGAALAHFTAISLPDLMPLRVLYSGILVLASLLAASVLGTITIPALALFAGAMTEGLASEWVRVWLQGGSPVGRDVLCAAFLVPVFFLTATHGMAASSSILASLGRCSPSTRTAFLQELAIASFFAILGLAIVFYFY
ncbi:MAG: hypothetical protein IK095_07765 [Oscillospiraceae bacterium]|nr:hypothetical protein [Oscillospiraceae bacterium]